MKCSCYCTAASYRIKPLADFLARDSQFVKSYRDAIHVRRGGDIFIFSYGCIVCWDVPEGIEHALLIQLHDYEKLPLSTPSRELFNYQLGESTSITPEKDLIILEAPDPLLMLAISFALAQSIKLVNFEDAVEMAIKNNEHIPQELAEKGKIALSRKEISQHIGNLFIFRNSINLNTDFLGTPEHFWENPRYENNYSKAAVYLEIQKRVEVLNKRLDVIRELFGILSEELRHQHSSTLELVIIWLIIIEIAIALIQYIIK